MNGRYSPAIGLYADSVPWAEKTQTTDTAAAGALLDQAGWVRTGDGPRTRDGVPLAFTVLTYPQQPDSNTLGVALQSQLKEVGFEVKVSQVPDITESREGDDWDVAIVGDSILSFTLSPVDGLRNTLGTGGPENYMKVSSSDLDDVIAALSKEFDAAKKVELLKQAQQIIADEGLWGATVRRKGAVVTNAKWKNYKTPIANLWVTARTAP